MRALISYTRYEQAAYVRCTWVWLHLARISLEQGRLAPRHRYTYYD